MSHTTQPTDYKLSIIKQEENKEKEIETETEEEEETTPSLEPRNK